MKPYPKYRPSGIAWLGDIPEQWDIKPLRAYLRPCSIRNKPDAQLLSVTRDSGVIVRNVESKEENHNNIPDDLSNYKYVQAGQFVINKMKAWQGSYGVSPFDGIVSPAYFVYNLSYPCPAYFSYAIRSRAFVPFFRQYSKGIRVDQWDLAPEALKYGPMLLPPLPEQEAIVAYLDSATAKIDQAIASEERAIDLLQERKQIIINQAVSPRYGWEVKPWNGIFENLDYLRKPISAEQRPRTNPQYDYYGASGVIDKIDYYNVDDTVLLIAEDGANLVLRNLPLVYKAKGKVWINNHAHILKPRVDNYDYLAFLLESYDYTPLITGSAQPKLSQGQLATIRLSLPSLPEQEAIVAHLDAATAKIDRAIAVKRRQIELLRERREIIIDAAVTGKAKI